MSTKAFTARLTVPTDEDQAALWRTHRVFNERLRWVLRQMHRMKRGDSDPRHAEIFRAITSNQHATACLEAVTSATAKPGKAVEWAELARQLLAEGKLLFDRKRELPGLSSRFWRKLVEAAFQAMSGHEELKKDWEAGHAQWLEDRAAWEAENSDYMKLRPLLEAFEKEHGQVAKRRERWHKWLAFLRSRPELAAWHGGPAEVNEVSEEGKTRVKRAQRKKRNRIESEEFFKANPALGELDRLHGYYQREFVRPWAKRRNPDGFRHPPTFTEPSAETHPFWFQFQKGRTCKDLDLKACRIRLKVLASDGPEPGETWHTFTFRPDPRLRMICKAEKPVSIGKDKYTYVFSDPALGVARQAEIRGAKLILRPASPDGAAYLSFTCDVPDMPGRPGITLTQKSCDKYSPTWVAKKLVEELGGQQPVTCAVDLGMRHLGAATVRRDGKIVRARILREDDMPGRGPLLPAIAAHKRALRKGRRMRGKPVAGEESFIDLQQHTDKMGQDRFKKGARRIVDFARQNGCDLIILEKLAGMIPDAERERGLNRAIVNWNRGNLAKWVKLLANDAGLRVVEVLPHWTSQLCSHCGSLGTRFSAGRDETTGKPGEVIFGLVEKTFACPECGYMANADHNASVNLHRKFYGELSEVKRVGDRVYRVTKPGAQPVEIRLAEVERRVLPRVADMCRGTATPF